MVVKATEICQNVQHKLIQTFVFQKDQATAVGDNEPGEPCSSFQQVLEEMSPLGAVISDEALSNLLNDGTFDFDSFAPSGHMVDCGDSAATGDSAYWTASDRDSTGLLS